jgi:enoyl-CoA hydratase/carnithine racemase
MTTIAHKYTGLNVSGNVATLVLNRPPVNALGAALIDEVTTVLDALHDSPDVSVLRISSTHNVFCAGADLQTLEGFVQSADPAASLRSYASKVQAMIHRLEALPAVTVCEITGAAMGGGLELALAADFRIASDRATFGLPEVALGLIPAAGGTQRLARLCGIAAARRMILRGRTVNASEAHELSLVDEVFPTAEFEEKATTVIDRLAKQPPAALRSVKACLVHALPVSQDGLLTEIHAIGALINSDDAQQRIQAFLRKSAQSA